MSEYPVTNQEQDSMTSRILYEDQESIELDEALCEGCILNTKANGLEARRWAFEPPAPIDPDAEIEDFDKNAALACLSCYRRKDCHQPPPKVKMEAKK